MVRVDIISLGLFVMHSHLTTFCITALRASLERKGWEVDTQIGSSEDLGTPLDSLSDTFENRERVLNECGKRALILMNSHVGGHKFAGNVLVNNTIVLISLC